MKNLVAQMQDAMLKRIAYSNTVRELRAMPLDTALDLDIQRSDARKIAAQAVYG